MMTLKVTKNQGFTLSLQNTILELYGRFCMWQFETN